MMKDLTCDQFTANEKRVLQLIYQEKQLTRNDIKEQTNLSLTSITKFITEMLNSGIILENGTFRSTGGRKSAVLSINPNYAYIIAIDLGGWSTKIGIVRLDGSILNKEIIPTDHHMPAFGFDMESLSVKIAEILKQHEGRQFLGICISVSGMVDVQRGRIIFCPNIRGWNNIAVVDELQNRFGLPVYLDTSPRCMALAEQWFGVGVGVRNQFFVSLGTYSISAGIIIDSNLYRGSFGFSGEFGHIQVLENGSTCTCGNRGCLELYASLSMIMDTIYSRIKNYTGYSPLRASIDSVDAIDLPTVKRALENGDKIVLDVLNQAARMIGTGLANIVNILNPEMVIIGGGVIENFPSIVSRVEDTVREHALVTTQQNLEIKKSELGQNGAMMGSAVQAIGPFLALN